MHQRSAAPAAQRMGTATIACRPESETLTKPKRVKSPSIEVGSFLASWEAMPRRSEEGEDGKARSVLKQGILLSLLPI